MRLTIWGSGAVCEVNGDDSPSDELCVAGVVVERLVGQARLLGEAGVASSPLRTLATR